MVPTLTTPPPAAAVLAVLPLVASQFVVVLAWLWERIHEPGVSTAFALLAVYLAVTVLAGLLAAIIDHVTRVVLTPSHLRVHRGLWSDDIPIGAIERMRVEPEEAAPEEADHEDAAVRHARRRRE